MRLILTIPISLRLIPDPFVRHLAALRMADRTSLFPRTLKRLADLGQVGVDLWRTKASAMSSTRRDALEAVHRVGLLASATATTGAAALDSFHAVAPAGFLRMRGHPACQP